MVASGIEKVVADGIVSRDGELHAVDVIITATGYDTSYTPRFPIVGLQGVNLQDKWRREGAAAYMSCAVPGFPNYFSEFLILHSIPYPKSPGLSLSSGPLSSNLARSKK